MAGFSSLTPLAYADSLLSMGAGVCRAPNPPTEFVTSPEGSGEAALPTDVTRVVANQVNGQNQVQVQARGRVIVERNTQTLNADWADYDQQTQIIKAGDRFTLSDGQGRLTGEKITYNMDNETGIATHARFENQLEGRRLQGVGKEIQMGGRQRYRMITTQFNTCNPGDDSWYIRARSIDADYQKNVGVARHATLVFGGVPLLYTPWIDFPLNGNRKSGLLAPMIKTGSDGFELMLPYYFNLAPNYDATFLPHFIGGRGMQLGGDFRYLTEKSHGTVHGEWLPEDRKSDRNNRYRFDFEHKQSFSEHLSGGIDYHRVSDDNYQRDFWSADNSDDVNLNRQIWFNHQTTVWQGLLTSSLNAQKYQTLASIAGYKDEPYGILPRLSTTWNRWFSPHYQVNVRAEATRFTHDSKQEGNRYVIYPSLTGVFAKSWGYIQPKIGFHATHYDLDSFDGLRQRSINRTLPIVTIDSGLTFERQWQFNSKKYTQTLEPRLYYAYIPARNQNDLPLFDTSENSFTYEQLFRANRYSGQDRINAANFITTALQSRFYDKETGIERLNAGIGQRFYFSQDDVLLDGSLADSKRKRSDILAFARANLNERWHAEANWHYNQNRNRTETYDAGVRYTPKPGKVISARYKYGRYQEIYDGNYGTLRQINAGVQWPVSQNYSVVARENYDLDNKKSLSRIFGVEYQSPCKCWSASVIAQRRVNDYHSTKNAFFFQLQLRDLTSVGNNPYEQLRTAIPGYRNVYEVNH